MWSALTDLASVSPWLVVLSLLIIAGAFVVAFALSLRGTGTTERAVVIRAFAELVRSVRGTRR
ncbi:hypothetical protein [Kitasatospora sp. NPDC002040]|uniref:hypothetical protein n=1 Tax=Kitasatospora sp. NPDC002040 TaxID=3154661 RepID=UPI00332FDCFD